MGIGSKTVDEDFQVCMASQFLERFLRLDAACSGPLKFNTSGTQVVDLIGNGCPIADYKAGLMRFSGVGSANSKAANSDFWAGVISVKPLKVLPSAVCTVC